MPLQVSHRSYSKTSIQNPHSLFTNKLYYSSFQVIIFYLLLTIFGIGLLSLSYYFLTWLTPWDWTGTSSQLWGATLYTFIFPLAFMLTMTGISGMVLMQSISARTRAIIMCFSAIACLFISIFSLCPTMFNGYHYFYFPKQNHLYKTLESLQMLVLWFPIGLVLFAICIRFILYHVLIGPVSSHYQLIKSSTTTTLQDVSKRNPIIILLFITILLPLIFFATTLLPNIWTHMDTETIYKWSTTPAGKAKKQWTIDWQLNKYYLHLYFDIILFYGAIFITAFIPFIFRQMKILKNCFNIISLRKIIIFSKCFSGFYLSGANLIFLLIWIPTICLLFYYWAFVHSYHTLEFNETAERISRAFGILSCVCIGLSLIPITRSNITRICEYCFGIEFQEGIVYHKFLAILFLIFSFAHYTIFIVLFILNRNNHKNDFIPYFNVPWSYHSANFTISLMYAVLLLIIIPIFVILSLFKYFRRYYFELFYYLHLYGAQVLIVSILFHAHNAWYYLLPGLILQLIERLYRIYNGTQIVKLITLEEISSTITKLKIAIPHKYSFASGNVWSSMNNNPSVKLCQYCFINIPNISPLQWHPFSISNPLNYPTTIFYIKNMYRGWTKKLNRIAAKSYCINNLSIGIEGPYGITLDFENYHHIILVAGGIGITPMHNIFFTLYHEVLSHSDLQLNQLKKPIPSIELWWINRRANAFSYYIESFRRFQSNPVEFMKIKLYATREKNRNSVVSDPGGRASHFQKNRQSFAITWDARRPYLPTALNFMKEFKGKGLIYVCGPKSMVDDCVETAYNNGNHLRREYFLW